MKGIRPLTSFKKENPDLYDRLVNFIDGGGSGYSKKQQENEIYWNYCFFTSGIVKRFDNVSEIINEPEPKDPSHKFFWKDAYTTNHKTLITEMGRLLLTGWYYNIEEFTKDICKNIYNGYLKANEKGKAFNEEEATKTLKNIRENIGYYYHNPDELKLYLLEIIFSEDVKKYLPEPPEEIKKHEWVVDVITSEKKRNLKQDKDYYYILSARQESYIEHLQEVLEEYGIVGYMSFEESKKKDEAKLDEYIEEVIKAHEQYDELKKKTLLSSKKTRKLLT
jgi:hypothetical protein